MTTQTRGEESLHPSEVEGTRTGNLSLEAEVIGLDGMPIECPNVSFWRALEACDPEELPLSFSLERMPLVRPGIDHWVMQDRESGKRYKILRSGRLVANDLMPGEYRITASRSDRFHDLTPTGISEPIRLDGKRQHTKVAVRLLDGPTVMFRAKDEGTGETVTGLELALARDDGLPLFFIDDGHLPLKRVPPGRYSLHVRRGAQLPEERDYLLVGEPMRIDITAGQDREVLVRLRAMALDEAEIDRRWPWVATGRVTHSEGKPLQDVVVRVAVGSGSLFDGGITRTDSNGKYRLRFIPGRGSETEKGEWHAGLQVALFCASKAGFVQKDEIPPDEHHHGRFMMMASVLTEDMDYRDKVILPHSPREIDFVMVPQ
jgi:hypothetical protein